ncbi:hypothetical protein LUZ60_013720 [Juncus effusus]|nr:hypothetical protein LUZ60_013720 [Juncus effusus]
MMVNNETEAIPQLTEEQVLFNNFMISVAKFDELVAAGNRFLQRFHQELEYFRRPEISEDSKIINEIIKSNMTERMKSYLDAGCTMSHQNIQNITQLNSCELGLKDYIKKAKILINEMECVADNAYKIAMESNQNITNSNFSKNNFKQDLVNQEDERKEQALNTETSVEHIAIMMLVIYNMLKLDYTMQEKIVRNLSHITPSSELESYSLMWDLRPHVNHDIVRYAWKIHAMILSKQ